MDLIQLKEGSITANNALASVRRTYYLVVGGVETEIPKPDGWTGLNITLQRDAEWHGFTYEGSESSLLRFHVGEGLELLQDSYQEYAYDADVYIKEVAGEGGDAVVEWEGRLDFTKYRHINDVVELPAERKSIANLVEKRWADALSMNSETTIGGLATTGFVPAARLVSMHGQALLQRYINNRTEADTVDWEDLRTTSKEFYIQLDTQSPEISEINEANQFSMGTSITSPVAANRYLLKPTFAGNFDFNINIEFQYDAKIIEKSINFSNPKFDLWEIGFELRIGSNIFEMVNESGFGSSQYASESDVHTPIGLKTLKFTYTGSHFVQSNQPIFIIGKFSCQPSNSNYRGIEYFMRNLNTSYNIEAVSVTTSSLTYGYKIKDCLDFVTRCISDSELSLVSDFYNNCGADRIITSGLALRQSFVNNLNNADNPKPEISLRDLFMSLKAIDGAGFGYEQLPNGDEQLRLEPRSHFYQDELIMDLSDFQDISTYSEEVALDKLYSEVVIGYDKYPNEDISGLDEFNTEHTYRLPTKYINNSLTLKSPISASGYEIESLRRRQLDVESKESTDSDNINFIICTRGGNIFSLIDIECNFREPYEFSVTNTTQTPKDPGNVFLTDSGDLIVAGAGLSIAGTTSNNGIFNVEKVEHIANLNTYAIFVTETVVYENGVICSISVIDNNIVVEKNQSFDVLNDSVLDASTSYNLRINPRYMLLANSDLINSGLQTKLANDKILVSKIVHNKNFEIQRKESENCIQGDPNRVIHKANESVLLSQLNNRIALYFPERVTMTFHLQPEQVRYIVRSHRNLSPDNNNYGYLTFKNVNGLVVEGYLLSLSIVEQSQTVKCEMVFIKKKVNTI
jgi:hypothetical protein